MRHTDVLIIGGGAIGSAAALFLRRAAQAPGVIVVEPDPAYTLASTPRATGGVRRLFSLPENIGLAQASLEFFLRWEAEVGVPDETGVATAPDLGWKPGGYLFVVDDRATAILERNAATQRHLGAGYVQDKVSGLTRAGRRVRAVTLASGERIVADVVINATSAWAAGVCAMIGMPLPVSPMRRFEHYVEIAETLEPLPLIKDLDRLVCRPEVSKGGRGYSVGLVDGSEQRGFHFDVEPGYFERVVWPALAHRLPAFEALKLNSEWSGLYDENELDGNMILGNWPVAGAGAEGGAENFYVAAGFSGHGLMHAPAVGRALAELIVEGRYRTLDLARLDYRRVRTREALREEGII